MLNNFVLSGCLVWGIVIAVLFCLRSRSRIHSMTLAMQGRAQRILILTVMAVTIVSCTAPMNLSPCWNGELPLHRNQYELMAESILDGHLYIDYDDIDSRLLEMENPYDPEARSALGVSFHWDHAFYEGKYYMYFGIVPVFLLFLPYRVIFGTSLTTYHASQIFAALFICGVFALFYVLARKFFDKLTLGMYLMLSSACSAVSVWYCTAAPALYCTAIISGICMGIWSLYFFVRAVWIEEDDKKQICSAFFGSLFGALAFGCRPSAALASLLVLPMLWIYLQKKKINVKLLCQLLAAASPYIVVGILLMVYNYVRFDSPFEFGQAYQLTLADQSSYGSFFEEFNFVKILNGLLTNFVSFTPMTETFPYLSFSGAWVNFPILFFAVIAMLREEVRKKLKEKRIRPFVYVLFFMPFFITMLDTMWAPFLQERYRMDIYWLMGILCYLMIGFYYTSIPGLEKRKFSCTMSVWALVTICTCILLFLVPYDNSYTACFPDKLESIRKVLEFGRAAAGT